MTDPVVMELLAGAMAESIPLLAHDRDMARIGEVMDLVLDQPSLR